MTRRVRHLVRLLVGVAAFGLVATPTAATPPTTHTMKLWTLPPVDSTGNVACLTQGWHGGDAAPYGNRGLDWKALCGSSGTEPVYLRVLGADINEPFGPWYEGMYAVATNLMLGDCPGNSAWNDSVHIGKVKLFNFESSLKGHLLYGHTLFDYPGDVPIQFLQGATRSNAWYTSVAIGDTKNDGVDWNPIDGNKDFTDCWRGWHTHENNSVDSTMHWVGWNGPPTAYPNSPSGGSFVNNDRGKWTRQMTWTWLEYP